MKKIITLFLFIIILFPVSNVNAEVDSRSFDQKIGMNGHIDVPQDILTAGGVVREYHNFGWSITNNKEMYFNKYSWWNFDNYYRDLSSKGIEILPCIQMGEQSIFNRNRNEKPVMLGDDTTNPLSYKIHSNYLFNYAARYGSSKVDSSRLNLDSHESVVTGLGYINYYEDWNEPDKTWQGEDARFNSTELVAMLSADYDGHEKRLGENYGVKNASKNSKLVMGGMAGGSTMVSWLDEMKNWASINRNDKKLPFDVINYHQYTSTHSPENSTFVSDALKIINWRRDNDPSKEIWITEFGWDTNLNSSHSAPNLNTQRDWIIREYLIGDRIGLDRIIVYDALNDGISNNSTQYATSGLATNASEGFIKKSSWYGVNTVKNTLKGFKFNKVIKEDNNIYIYNYINENNDEIYALWSPTENGNTINNYKLNVGNRLNAVKTELKDKEALGVTSSLTITNNEVVVDVSESPIFIKVSGNDNNNSNNSLSDNNQNKDDIINKSDVVVTSNDNNNKTKTSNTNKNISTLVSVPNTSQSKAIEQSLFGIYLIAIASFIIVKCLKSEK